MQDPGRPKVEQDMSSVGFVPDFLCVTGKTFLLGRARQKRKVKSRICMEKGDYHERL
jgi:hypothetical protein